MRLYFDCVPCVVGQVTSAVKRFIPDEEEQYRVLNEAINTFYNRINKQSSAPVLAAAFFEEIKRSAGIEDLYLPEKQLFNREMLSLEADFRRIIQSDPDPLRMAILLSAGANIIDYGIVGEIDKGFALNTILTAVRKAKDLSDLDTLKNELAQARQLLYVGDNCGEIVLDKLVLEVLKQQFPALKIVYAVRGKPILNDVTVDEAHEVGLDQYATIISSGSALPGTIVHEATEEFQRYYNESDVVILKGMGNLETAAADECKAFFIFMVKCDFIANHLGADMHEIKITRGNHLYEENRTKR